MADSDRNRKKPAAGRKPPVVPAPKSPRKSPMKDKPESTPTTNVFDAARIRELVDLMKEHDLSEIDLREMRHRIRICRGPKEAPRVIAAPAAYSAPAPAASAGASVPAAPAADAANIAYIKSPMVGTFYAKANPKATDTFVKVGDSVSPATTVCIIEAMKVFNEIPAEIQGKIVAILVEDGEAVEFDKPLFKIETGK